MTSNFQLSASNCQLSMFNFLSPIEFPAPPVNLNLLTFNKNAFDNCLLFNFQQKCSNSVDFHCSIFAPQLKWAAG